MFSFPSNMYYERNRPYYTNYLAIFLHHYCIHYLSSPFKLYTQNGQSDSLQKQIYASKSQEQNTFPNINTFFRFQKLIFETRMCILKFLLESMFEHHTKTHPIKYNFVNNVQKLKKGVEKETKSFFFFVGMVELSHLLSFLPFLTSANNQSIICWAI